MDYDGILATLLREPLFHERLASFLEERYCLTEEIVQSRLKADSEQALYLPVGAIKEVEENDSLICLLYTDSDNQIYTVIYYGQLDGSGNFRDSLVHEEDCCGYSCIHYGCPLYVDSDSE